MILTSLSRNIKILLIESDRDAIDLIEDVFLAIERETNCSIFCWKAQSLENIQKYLKVRNNFDIILLDLFLQESQGLTTLNIIQQWSLDLPIIVLGDESTKQLCRQVLEVGVQDYILKNQIGSQLLIRSLTYAIERQKTQNALRQSEEKYRFVVNSIKEVIFQIDREGNWLFLNAAWQNVTGLTVEKTLGKPAIAYVHPDDIARHEAEFNALISGEKTKSIYNLRCFCSRVDCYCEIEINASPTLLPSGEISGISGTFEDLTDYKQQKEQLKTITLQRDRLAENVPGTIYQLCQSKRGKLYFSYISQGCQNLFEFTPQIMIENSELFFDLLQPQERDRFLETLENSSKTLQPWELEFCITTRSRKQKWLKGSSKPEKRNNGDILWDGIIVDITPLKQTENALLQQQELLLKIIQNSPNAWYFYDFKNQKYIYLNQCLRRILGYSSEEFYQQNFHFKATHPEDIKQLEIYFDQLAGGQDGESFTIEYRMCHKSGDWRWFLSQDTIFVRGENGYPTQVIGTMMDISELKEIESQLKENKDRLQLALESSYLSLWDWNLSTGEVCYDRQWKEFIGYKDDEFSETLSSFESLVHPDDLSKIVRTIDNYSRGDSQEIVLQIDFRMRTKQEEWKWFVARGQVTAWDENENPVRILGTVKDISDRKQTELELHLLLSAARAINRAPSFQDAIAIILPLFCQTIGWDVAEAWIPIDKGKNLQYTRGGYASKPELQEFIDRSRDLVLIPNIGFAGKIYKERKPEWIEDVSHPREENFYRREIATKAGLRACFGVPILKNKRVLAILVFFNTGPLICDLHLLDLVNVVAAQLGEFMQRKRVEERALNQSQQLRKAMKQLKYSQSQAIHNAKIVALGQLVAGIAHEINNPISFIYGNIEPALNYAKELLELIHLYQKHYPEPMDEIQETIADLDLEFLEADFLKLLESMKTGGNRIREIIKSLRNFSRLDESDRKAADLHEGLNNTLMLLQHRLKSQDDRPRIQVVKNFASLPKIECYPGDLNQVFMNLLNNAIDALEEKLSQGVDFTPKLTLKTEIGQYRDTQKSCIRIHVADNGTGIPPSLQSRIFDPFFTTKSIGKGTGLGLTTSYDIIVEKHNGRLYCASEVGLGTEFAIELPFQ